MLRFTSFAGSATIVAGFLQTAGDSIYALDRIYPGQSGFAFTNANAAIWHCLFVLGLIGLLSSGVAGPGWLGRIGLSIGIVGMGLLIAAEILTQLLGEIPALLIGASVPVTGLGLVLAGIAVLRSRRWRGWRAVTPLLVGAYPLLVMLPAFALLGEANYIVVAGWGLFWMLLGFALLTSSEPAVDATPAPATVAVAAAGASPRR